MRDECQVFELLVAHRVRVRKVADVSDIGLEQLVEGLPRIADDHERSDRPSLHRSKAVGNETLAAQLKIDFAEAWLILVERHERDFGLDRHRLLQLHFPSLKHCEFAALNVDLEKVKLLDLGDVVEHASLQWDALN